MARGITDIHGIKVGHYTDEQALTGCTVVLCPHGAVAGVDVRGAAPGTRETDLLRPGHLVERAHAILLGGGSAFGLEAASGVMEYLEENGYGFDVQVARVPIVPAAVLFDLTCGDPRVRPGREAGYQACRAAGEEVAEGNVGAGTGATVGKLFGLGSAMKGGLGTASQRLDSGVTVGALVAVNAYGDILDESGQILAGTRNPMTGQFINTADLMRKGIDWADMSGMNTTIGVVATNARLDKAAVNRVASMAHNGLARAISPVHTMYDGDTIFALSYGNLSGDVSIIGTVAAQVMAEAVRRAVLAACSVAGIPAAQDVKKNLARLG
ncbi:MAG: P1 family peptidase [Bacillota bacterium]